jgi:AhpD family alkylhydroperoxidase
MHSRMKSPALTLPRAMETLQLLSKSVEHGGIPRKTLELLNLRASQINGCSVCVDMHSRALKKLGESDARIHSAAVWREAPYYTEAERAALALTEAGTRLADRGDPVPDAIWEEAARHFNDQELSSLVMSIAVINLWNRLNALTRQVSGEWTEQYA